MRAQGASLYELAPTYLRNRYRILFYTVLLTLVSVPILSAFKFSGILIESFLAANLLAAIMPVSGVRSRPYLLLGMVAVWLVRPFTAWLEHPTLSATALAIWTVIGLLAAAAALRFAMSATNVDAEHLYAALSAYLLAGIYFGLLYLGSRADNPRHIHRVHPFFPDQRNLLQFRHLGDTGLWRHCSTRRYRAWHCHHRRRWRSTIPSRFSRKARQPVFEACRQLA